MTIRPLPDIDLARIAPLGEEKKRKSLEQMKGGFSPFSYRPLRSCLADIFNIQPGFDFGDTPRTSWPVIETLLKKKSKSEAEFRFNRRVARGLFQFSEASSVLGRREDFTPLSLGTGGKVVFWLSMILEIESRPTIVFVEPRRTRGLTSQGRRFAFSMMHEHIRVADDDFSNVRLAIIRFADPDGDCRAARLHFADDVDLYTYAELEQMVSSTYEMWADVLNAREDDARRKATGTGPLI